MSTLAGMVLPAVSALVIFSFLAVTPADADLWGHLTFGRDIVQTGTIARTDSYSFTSDQPWTNHEWLAEVTMWLAYDAGGAPGLVALKLLLACLVALALLAAWGPRAFPNMWRDALLCAVAMSTWPQLQFVRPQLFSLVLFAWLLVVLERVRDGRLVWLLALPPMFAVWVNFHGGWIVGAAALLTFAAWTVVNPAAPRRAKAALAVATGAALLATLCNPYGSGMLAFLADTVRPNRADIVEWRPLSQVGGFMIAIWVLDALLAAFVLWRRRGRVPPASLLIVLLFAAGGLRVARLVGFFALSVALLLVPLLGRPEGVAADATAVGSAFRRISRRQPAFGRLARPLAVCLLACACALALFGRRIQVDAPWMPEPEAAGFIEANGLRGNMLTWFDYGEYAIWHLSPAIRVSMDGRRETVYSDRMRALHTRIYLNDPAAMADVEGLGAQHAWLPRDAPVIPALEAHGWRRVFDGPRSVVLTRSTDVPSIRTTAAVLPRWFPGP